MTCLKGHKGFPGSAVAGTFAEPKTFVMRALRILTCPIFLMATVATSSAQQAVWNIDSSTAVENRTGAKEFRMVLQRPGGDLMSKGASAGATLFEGERDGDKVIGLAWTFAAGCPSESYEVSGEFSTDGTVFSIQGRAPVKDASCKVSSFQDKTLIFTKRPTVAPAPAAPPPSASLPPAPTPNTPQRSYWAHNGSTLYLVVNGSSRELYYDNPTPGMLAAGAQPGTLLFRGRYAGGNYVGTAYIFSPHCGPLPYQVSGPVTDNFEKITVQGSKPIVDANCRITRQASDTLVFALCVKTLPPGASALLCP
jgi:hypothetical protein